MRLVPSLNQTKIDATEKKLNVRSLVMLRVYALASFQFFRLCQFNLLVPLIRVTYTKANIHLIWK